MFIMGKIHTKETIHKTWVLFIELSYWQRKRAYIDYLWGQRSSLSAEKLFEVIHSFLLDSCTESFIEVIHAISQVYIRNIGVFSCSMGGHIFSKLVAYEGTCCLKCMLELIFSFKKKTNFKMGYFHVDEFFWIVCFRLCSRTSCKLSWNILVT